MSTTLKDPNSAENDAKEKLQDPYRHKSLPSNGDADSPYANPEDIKKDIADRSVIGDAERNARPTNQEASIDQRENAGHSWTNNVSEKAKSDAISKKFLKKKGVWILFGVGGVSIFSIFNTLIFPSLMLVHVASAVLTGDVAGVVSQIVEDRKTHIANKQIRAMNKEATKRCGTIAVKCKYKGIGPVQKKKLKMAGIDVECGRSFIPGRCNPKKFIDTRTGKSYGPRAFEKEMRSNADFRNRAYKSFHKGIVMTYAGEKAKSVWKKFGIFRGKRPPISKDDEPSKKKVRIRTLFRGLNANNGGELRAGTRATKTGDDPATASENAKIEETNEQIKQTDEYTRGYGDELKADADDPNKAVPPDPIDASSNKEVEKAVDSVRGSGAMNTLRGALVPTAIFDEFCRVKGIVKSVSAAKKVLANRQLIAYSFEFMRLANQIKAGDADGNTVQEISDMATYFTSKDDQGESAFDSFGWNWGVDGKVSKQGEGEDITKYQLGGGGVANEVADTIPQAGCDITGNPIVQGTAVAVTLIPGVGQAAKAGMKLSTVALKAAIKKGVERIVEGGIKKNAAKVAKNPLARMGAMQAFWMYAVPPLITNVARASTGTVITGDERGKDVGNAFVGGFGALNASGARAQGLQPLTKDQLLGARQEIREKQIQLAKEGRVEQFNINDPNSFLSKVFVASAPTLNSLSVSNFPTKIAGLSIGSFSNLTANTYADFQPEAYDICVDNDYEDLGVAVDPFCNPQYGFSANTINSPQYDAEAVTDYMYDGGYVTASGDPTGDYEDFLKKCPDAETLEDAECMNKDVKHTMFGLYTLDSSIYDDIEAQGSEEEDDTGLISGDAQELAQQILKNESIDLNSSNFCRYCTEDIKNTADGKPAYGDVEIDVNLLKFLAELGEKSKVDVNSITGAGSGHSGNSNHYKGTAIDFGCSLNKSLADTIGKKYGITRYTGEWCPDHGHWHYSVGGN